ncbi:putative nuclease HARBI1 [Saccostrea echinata]|uniref:putative nuclease HARBI1 n=1 Tax=Saccostrea echinata TaxID=191078 RepID=UPI002A841461|nr:putative nuclease HARBI1 [Saccostrea echinata]
MPVDVVELNKIKKDFYGIAHFPNTVGAIDCTHIRMKAPTTAEHIYVNRKNYHSINIQGVCDSTLKFLNVVARWPGSTHDAFIWFNSELKRLFVNGTITEGWLLGDSGYPLRPWLLHVTPVLNHSQAKERYNTAHIRTRNVIERAFGVLKARLRCLDSSGGTLLYNPGKVCKIFVATAVLHMCIIERIPLPEGRDPHDN